MQVGDYVTFTGDGYRRAIQYNYKELFGDRPHRINDIRTSCCNTFLVLDGIDGMYSDAFFDKTPPGTLYPT